MYVKPYPPEIEERMRSLYNVVKRKGPPQICRDRGRETWLRRADLPCRVAGAGLQDPAPRAGENLDHPPELPPGRIRKKGSSAEFRG